MKNDELEKRWFRWDVMFNEGKYLEIVKECDGIIKRKERLTIGDIVRRDQCLEKMDILMYKKKENNGEFKRGKSKTKNGNSNNNNDLRK